MSVPWFFAPPSAWAEERVTLDPAESHHAVKVMRVGPPDVITVTDGAGRVARCAVQSADKDGLVAEILERQRRPRARPEIVVYQAVAKGHKLDDVVERLAELGVAELWAYSSERSVARWDDAKLERLDERWASIARSAAKQSRSPHLLQARAGLTWTDLLERVRNEPLALCLWEQATLPLRAALVSPAERVALLVGPEGGLTRDEVEELADAGAPSVSLGPQILRTENAPVVAASALLFHYGLIG